MSSSYDFSFLSCYDPRLPNSYQQAKLPRQPQKSSIKQQQESGVRRQREEEQQEGNEQDRMSAQIQQQEITTSSSLLTPHSDIEVVLSSSSSSFSFPSKITDGIRIDDRDPDVVLPMLAEESDSSQTLKQYHNQAKIVFPAVVQFARKAFFNRFLSSSSSGEEKNLVQNNNNNNNNSNNNDSANSRIRGDTSMMIQNNNEQPKTIQNARIQMIADMHTSIKSDPSSLVSGFVTHKPTNTSLMKKSSSGSHQRPTTTALFPSNAEAQAALVLADDLRRKDLLEKRMSGKFFGTAGRGRRLMVKMGHMEGEALSEGGLKQPLRILKGGALNESDGKKKNLMMSNQLSFRQQ